MEAAHALEVQDAVVLPNRPDLFQFWQEGWTAAGSPPWSETKVIAISGRTAATSNSTSHPCSRVTRMSPSPREEDARCPAGDAVDGLDVGLPLPCQEDGRVVLCGC